MFKTLKQYTLALLKRSENVTGTDNVYIARHGFWTTLGYGTSSIIGLATVWVYANTVPKELYGTYKYILALVGGLGVLTISGINSAVSQAVARGYDYALVYAVRVQLLWNTLYTAVGLGIAMWYLWHHNFIFGWSIVILALALPLVATLNTYGPYLVGKKEFRLASITTTASSVFTSIVILIALLTTENIIIWVAAYAVGNILPNAFLYFRIARRIPQAPDTTENSSLLRFAGHVSLINILSQIAGYLDKVLLFQYIGPVAVATYSFASIGTDRVKGWVKGMSTIILPKLTERSLEEIDKVFYRRTFQAVITGLLSSALYSLAIPVLFKIFFPRYIEAVRYSQVLSLSLIGTVAGGYMGQVFSAHKMVRTIYFSATGAHGLRIILFVVLGYFYGIWGMIWATISTQILGTILNLILWEVAMRRAGLRQR